MTERKPVTVPGWALVDETTGEPVHVGDRRTNFRGAAATVTGGRPPLHRGSTGRIGVRDVEGTPPGETEFYPSVFDAKWVQA